jgi:hypothetical protein
VERRSRGLPKAVALVALDRTPSDFELCLERGGTTFPGKEAHFAPFVPAAFKSDEAALPDRRPAATYRHGRDQQVDGAQSIWMHRGAFMGFVVLNGDSTSGRSRPGKWGTPQKGRPTNP